MVAIPGKFMAAAGLVLAGAVAAPARADAVDDYLQREMARRGIPGLAVAVVRHGRVERVSTYGMANLETGAPVTPDSIFAIASLDKGLVAAGVLKAGESGKIALADPVTKYLELPLPGISMAMLLSHTSGLPDMDEALAGTYGTHVYQSYTSAELLAAIGNTNPAAPGARYHYSDAGIFLAQLATEKATGRPWLEWMQEVLFRPAGMMHVVSMDPHAIIPQRVAPYTFDAAQHLVRDGRNDVDYGPLYNDLGMTIGDFAHWLIALDGHGPLGAASIQALWTPARLADGTPARDVYPFSGYGLGTGVDDVLGQRVILHTGHSGVAYMKFPALDLGVVVFTNLEHPQGSDPSGLVLGVAGLLEPVLSLRGLAPPRAGEPPAVHALRRAYEAQLAGTPDLAAYAPALQDAVWRDRAAFDDRLPRLGPLVAWTFLRESLLDGEPTYLFRAAHERGEIYVRYSLDARGRISRLVWWHL